ncbi:MAG: hypothetical protein M1121_04950 [Actinobacteria bacterium]|nr:hypothetical protein [Actinomycetota bacterium]
MTTTLTEREEVESRAGELPSKSAGGPVRRVTGRVLTRRSLTIALGVLWFVDGLLQLQPFMFTKGFLTGILAPMTVGQPGFIAATMEAIDRFIAPHLVAWNALFALVQLAIGVGLIFRRFEKVALVVSFAWVVAVWWIGEGFGGLLTGSATLLTGAPGSVLLYGLVGVVLWPARGSDSEGVVAEQGVLGSVGSRILWCVLWLGGAALSLLPANRSPDAISIALKSGATGEPGFISSIDRAAARLTAGHGMSLAVAMAVIEVGIGLGVLLRWHPGAFLALGATLAVVFWVVGQDLGGIFTGQGTDPNSGPLVVLLAATMAGTAHLKLSARNVSADLERRSVMISSTNVGGAYEVRRVRRSPRGWLLASLAVVGIVLAGCSSSSTSANSGSSSPVAQATNVSLSVQTGKMDGKSGWPRFSPADFSVTKGGKVVLTITSYDDGAAPLPAGMTTYDSVQGGTETVDGKTVTSVANSEVAHTFTVSTLGLNVPIPAVAAGHKSVVVVFTFTPSKSGSFIWKCMAPCGSGSDGMSGAMATMGWMEGKMTVS